MTIANINVRQILLKRGNTSVSNTYTGPIGEITVDTGLDTIRVHDGVTPGGTIIPTQANAYAYANLAVGDLQTQIDTLTANTEAQQTLISNIIDGTTTFGNLLPSANVVYSLGSAIAQWKDLYVSSDTIYIGGTALSVSGGNLLINGSPVQGGGTGVVTVTAEEYDDNIVYYNPSTQELTYAANPGRTILPYVELTNNPFIFEPYVGEAISFTKEDYATGAEATDEVDTGLAITRGEQRGIYNPYLELQWDRETNDGTSPLGTLWNIDGWEDLTNVADRRYYSFYDINNGQIGNNVLNTEYVMKDTANNRYYKFVFTVWGNNSNGAPVTYTRQEIDGTTGEDIGEPVEFVKAGYADPTEVNDPIDTDLTITRGNNQGIYNIALETSWSSQGDGEDSPEGTLWNNDGWGQLNDVKQRTYTTFLEALGYAIGENILGTELVMWDTINDKYWAVKFSAWTQNGDGGGFSYTRQQINTSQLFVKTDYGSEVDEISEGLHITRGERGWLYNPLEDEGYDDNTPTGSLWNNDGWDDLSNVESRTYQTLESIWNNNFNEIAGARMVMKDTTTDKYWAIEFLSWTQGQNGGGVSYLRYELDLDQLQEGVTFADGSVLKSADGLGRVKSTAPGNRRIEEVAGYKQVSVTEVTTSNTYNVVSIERSSGSPSWDLFIDRATNSELEAAVTLYGQYGGDDHKWRVTVDGQDYTDDNLQIYLSGAYIIIYSGSGVALPGDADLSVTIERITGGDSVVWWDKNELPSGGNNFRGAVIDYHAYTGESTIIGTIHIVDDDGEEHITHTEVTSGSTDGMNDNLWIVTSEGRIRYGRFDSEAKTLKIHWTAKVFYGSELYD
jgi:hypothetical protein